jgi:hypothetical protein
VSRLPIKKKATPKKARKKTTRTLEGGDGPQATLVKKKRVPKIVPPPDFAADLAEARKKSKSEEKLELTPKVLRESPGTRLTPPKGGGKTPIVADPLENPDQIGTQHMVAGASDLVDVKALQERFPDRYGKLTANQVWVLLAAHRKGEAQHERDMQRSAERLAAINQQFGTTYTVEHLPAILKALRERRLASNFFFSLPPGGNRDVTKTGDTLLDILIADKEGRFRNVWETGTSQASPDLSQRGGVEENFGYAFALKRTAGKPLSKLGGTFASAADPVRQPEGEFSEDGQAYLLKLREEAPNYLQPREMPKYGAAVGQTQEFGVSSRYGPSVVYWKTDVQWRSTRTPGDSWSQDPRQSALFFVGANFPEGVFANADPTVARLAAAEATGFEFDPELRARVKVAKDGAPLEAYVEAQIHGDLAWHDVDVIVVNYGSFGTIDKTVTITKSQAQQEVEKLAKFAVANGYGFKVRLGREHLA